MLNDVLRYLKRNKGLVSSALYIANGADNNGNKTRTQDRIELFKRLGIKYSYHPHHGLLQVKQDIDSFSREDVIRALQKK